MVAFSHDRLDAAQAAVLSGRNFRAAELHARGGILFCHQSTLSAGLKELEDVLGTRLVERDRQTVLMTPIGLEVVKRARAILSATQDLVEIAAESRAPMTGLLRLGVIPTIAPFLRRCPVAC
jgi:LysR family transcriptional regulator, hydrogen peroxide-inducible genes activator